MWLQSVPAHMSLGAFEIMMPDIFVMLVMQQHHSAVQVASLQIVASLEGLGHAAGCQLA